MRPATAACMRSPPNCGTASASGMRPCRSRATPMPRCAACDQTRSSDDWTGMPTGEYPPRWMSKGEKMSIAWTDTVTEIAGTKMHLSRAGRGRPVLVLHHDIGTPDRLPFYDTLAAQYDVLVPHHPGWGKSERPQWLRHP